VGFVLYGNLHNCFALNSSVKAEGEEYVNRVIGFIEADENSVSGNYGLKDMAVISDDMQINVETSSELGHNKMHGADITCNEATNEANFKTKSLPYWDFTNTWAFVTPPGTGITVAPGTNLPVLRVFKDNTGQNPIKDCYGTTVLKGNNVCPGTNTYVITGDLENATDVYAFVLTGEGTVTKNITESPPGSFSFSVTYKIDSKDAGKPVEILIYTNADTPCRRDRLLVQFSVICP